MIYLDVATPDEARREFERLFTPLTDRINNQKIFDAMKSVHAPHLRARVVDAKAEGSGERTSEGGAR